MALVTGLYFKEKHPKSPSFVIGRLSAKRDDLMAFLREQPDEWVNMQILMSKSGKPYIAIDEWKPQDKKEATEQTDNDEVKIEDIPF